MSILETFNTELIQLEFMQCTPAQNAVMYPKRELIAIATAILSGSYIAIPQAAKTQQTKDVCDLPYELRVQYASAAMQAEVQRVIYVNRWRTLAEEMPFPNQHIELIGLELQVPTKIRFNSKYDYTSIERHDYNWRPVI